MAGRIRQRPKVVWLPPNNVNRLGVIPPNQVLAGTGMGLGWSIGASLQLVATVGATTTAVFPVVADAAVNNAGGELNSLSDIEQSSYRLRRVVGKIFVGIRQVSDSNQAITGIITAGLIILRTRGAPLNAPLGAPFDYSTISIDNYADPWIWRRAWCLGNNAANLAAGSTAPFYPENNAICGSVLDGPHVDAKTARVVGPEERLFLVISATTAVVEGQIPEVTTNVECYWDLRVLASMRTNSGNRRNASR